LRPCSSSGHGTRAGQGFCPPSRLSWPQEYRFLRGWSLSRTMKNEGLRVVNRATCPTFSVKPSGAMPWVIPDSCELGASRFPLPSARWLGLQTQRCSDRSAELIAVPPPPPRSLAIAVPGQLVWCQRSCLPKRVERIRRELQRSRNTRLYPHPRISARAGGDTSVSV